MDDSDLATLIDQAMASPQGVARLLAASAATACRRLASGDGAVRVAPLRRPYHPRPIAHLHPYLELFVQVRGAGRMRLRDGDLPMSVGDLIIIPAGVAHDEVPDPDGFCNLVLSFHGDVIACHVAGGTPGPTRSRVRQHVHWHDHRAVRLLRYLDEAASAGSGEAGRLLARGLVQAHLALLGDAMHAPTAAPAGDALVERARLCIARHLCEPRLTVAWLARTLGVSSDHLTRRFRAVDGRPPLRAITEARLELAQDLLRDPDRGIAEIARACGFADAAYFSRRFRAGVHASPRLWRLRTQARHHAIPP